MKAVQVIKVDENLTPQELAKQLKKPEGDTRKIVGDGMNKSNLHINTNAFNLLDLNENDSVLEVGFGNGKLIPELFKRANNITYCGLDLSATMVDEATTFNSDLVKDGTVELLEGNINQLCYRTNTFDKIVTVNTLYFWDKPEEVMQELKRVLKPNGKLVIGIRDKDLVKEMPFTKFGFTLYKGTEAVELAKSADFKSVELINKDEPEIEVNGEVYFLTGSFLVIEK
jgi:ubiquinone/menaquinone biosynthesis C-methylase UbiE